jgi:starvation-inducible outer membrane lipoprotein
MSLNNKMKKTIFIFLALALSSCSYINKQMGLKDDNMIENNIENVIEHESGLQIDLTPSSPENENRWEK